MSKSIDSTVANSNYAGHEPSRHLAEHDDELHQIIELSVQLMRSLGLHRPDSAGLRSPVSLSEMLALGELIHSGTPSLSQQELSDRLQLEKSTVSRLIAGLQRRGWVTHQRDPANRRWSQVALTDPGRAATRELIEEFHQRHIEVLSRLSQREREDLTTGLTALLEALQEATSASPDEPE